MTDEKNKTQTVFVQQLLRLAVHVVCVRFFLRIMSPNYAHVVLLGIFMATVLHGSRVTKQVASTLHN